MPFIPHTEQEIQDMLSDIGVVHVHDLFAEIPASLKIKRLTEIPSGLSEMNMARLMEDRLKDDELPVCFAGAGAYEHHIPAAVWDIVMRGEYLTAYTPYQAEASQGTLQCLWEYQTMMASLMSHDVSNASLYDGATALVEAVLMSIRLKKKDAEPLIYLPDTVHPLYRQTLRSLLEPQGFEIVSIQFDKKTGQISQESLDKTWEENKRCTVLILPQPNFFGILEEASNLTDWAHEKDALVIGLVNPMAMAWLKPPGQWGLKGADIACGEGQPLGVPFNRGGPYFGFITCKQEYIRQLPGRLIGETLDNRGRRGFTLTLQAREQHIRRGKATSNICTNQGLLVTAATIYMSFLGPQGLKEVASASHTQTLKLKDTLKLVAGVQVVFDSPHFHEILVQVPKSSQEVIEKMMQAGFLAGVDVSEYYPELENAILLCATETKTDLQIEAFCQAFAKVLRG